jgi:hypothetical protein
MSGSTLWRIDNNTLANDLLHRLPVDAGPDQFEFELVVSGQRLADSGGSNSPRPWMVGERSPDGAKRNPGTLR